MASEIRDRRPEALGDLNVISDELLCSILENLTPRDVARLSCVSSVMYILCNEEPLWMSLCLNKANGQFQYKGSWKKTTLSLENVPDVYIEMCGKPQHFDGFSSMFLYRRLYRCHTTLDGFSFDKGNVERRNDISLEEFSQYFDGKQPVMLLGLADRWPARNAWSIEGLSEKYGDAAFRISQRRSRKTSMKFKDYVSYIKLQHDEDPLYVFDDKFGETAPSLLKDYTVPDLFKDDFFEVLDKEQRPPFRWLIIGPERSGASWHVDPALTSAWNTLLCGCKRWALYPPGKVPLGVTVHVNEEDGDVNIETPTSLQWWMDFYPLLADKDKPIECTQLPGETIFVPSGWWHCVLNLETTVAVTQNFVNSKNFEYVCLDLAPGYQHKGVCRAGFLAVNEGFRENVETNNVFDDITYPDLMRKEKRTKIGKARNDPECEKRPNGDSKVYNLLKQDFCYDIKFLATFLDEDRDHYNSTWSSSNCIGQREMREWLSKLWVEKPGVRELIWKGACLAINADRWLDCLTAICAFQNIPYPTDDEKLPVGTGSNPVYLLADSAVKIFVEGGIEASLYGLGTELEFYNLLCKEKSHLRDHVPEVLASGILFLSNGTFKVVPWDGKELPSDIGDCNRVENSFPLGVWSKKLFDLRNAGLSAREPTCFASSKRIWPFIITKRCRGKIFAQLRESLSWEEVLGLASFLGEQLQYLHLLPYPTYNISILSNLERKMELPSISADREDFSSNSSIPAEWDIFVRTLSRRRVTLKSRLKDWGEPIPGKLMQKVDEYIPDNLTKLIGVYKDEGAIEVCKPCSWIHSDIMDDNIHMEIKCLSPSSSVDAMEVSPMDNGSMNGHNNGQSNKSWQLSHILDFSDLSIGDRLYDLIPIYLDVFRGDSSLFKHFLESYGLPLLERQGGVEAGDKFERLSYHAMCYCILHEENILGAIFSIWRELRTAESWEDVELTVWGELNNYKMAS